MPKQSTRARETNRETIQRRLNRETDSVIVSLADEDGRRFTRLGFGPSHTQRVLDAYAQLPPGEYTITAVSTPSTVFSDVAQRENVLSWRPSARLTHPVNRYEGQRVSISPHLTGRTL